MGWLRRLPVDSALVREVEPDAMWDLHAQLLAAAVDSLVWANYQRTDGKGTKPKPIQRPGVKPSGRRFGKTDLPANEAREILRGYARGDYAKEATDG